MMKSYQTIPGPGESEMWLEVIADSYDMMLVDMDDLKQ